MKRTLNDESETGRGVTRTSPFDQASASAVAAAKKELQDSAALHKVRIQSDRLAYASDQKTTLVHAPLSGIEKYGDADFVSGAPIQLLIVRSTSRRAVPNGSYVVTAQHRPGATTGRVIFTNPAGVHVEGKLLVRPRDQEAALFPDVLPSVDIPVITSTHVWVGDPIKGHWAVDCAGWQPFRIVYYAV